MLTAEKMRAKTDAERNKKWRKEALEQKKKEREKINERNKNGRIMVKWMRKNLSRKMREARQDGEYSVCINAYSCEKAFDFVYYSTSYEAMQSSAIQKYAQELRKKGYGVEVRFESHDQGYDAERPGPQIDESGDITISWED